MTRKFIASADDTDPAVLLTRYLDGVVRLRQAAIWNFFDNTASPDLPKRVIPVVDADVIKMFMSPADETAYVDPFRTEVRDDARPREVSRDWSGPLALAAAITAEFTFLTSSIQT